MKIMIKSTCGKFFSKEPEVGLTDIKKNACIFYCHNEEHAFLILEKTKRFISNERLCLEFIEKLEVILK